MKWLQDLIDAAGTSQSKLALHLKIAPPRVSEMVRGERRLQRNEIKPTAEFFGLAPTILDSMIEGDETVIASAIERVKHQAAQLPGSPALPLLAANDRGTEGGDYPRARVNFDVKQGPEDIPLWASAAAGDDGAIILVPDPIGYLRRSERMLNVRNPFAFNVLGHSMSPAIDHGDQVVVNPSVVARPGMDCVFIHEGAEGMLALVKRLLRPGGEQWHVRQFNEPKDFNISRKKWGRVHPISEVKKAGV